MSRFLAFSFATALAALPLLSSSASAQSTALRAQPRVFARGVVTTIQPVLEPEETLSQHGMIEITADKSLEWTPEFHPVSSTLYGKAQAVRFGHEVWGLEFSFKPLRMIDVNVRQPNGRTERKMVWYLVYRIKNNGARLRPVETAEGDFTAEPAEPKPIEFSPHFVLEGQDVDAAGLKIYKAYLDRSIPNVIETIRRRELPGRSLFSTSQMSQSPIEVSTDAEDKSVWGVVVWEDVDPEMDFLSIYVTGLTNAYFWVDPPGAYQKGDPAGKGRRLIGKALQLNFWRPGDEHLQSEKEIRFGVPEGRSSLYGVEPVVAYRWLFR